MMILFLHCKKIYTVYEVRFLKSGDRLFYWQGKEKFTPFIRFGLDPCHTTMFHDNLMHYGKAQPFADPFCWTNTVKGLKYPGMQIWWDTYPIIFNTVDRFIIYNFP